MQKSARNEEDEEGDKEDSRAKEDKNDKEKAEEENKEENPDEDGEKQEEKQVEIESGSEEEFVEIDIKAKMRNWRNEHPGERYPDDMMNEAVRWRLNQNDCQNRGYVLDGLPRNYVAADGVFIIRPQAPERKFTLNEDGEKIYEEIDEDELKQLLKPRFQKNIYPDSVILLRAGYYTLQNKINQLSSEELAKSHWMPEMFDRRWNQYYSDNDNSVYNDISTGSDRKPPLTRFFQENKTEIYELDCDGDQYEMFEGMRTYIERNGRPYNYLSQIDELNQQREAHLAEEEAKNKDQQEKDKKVTEDQ